MVKLTGNEPPFSQRVKLEMILNGQIDNDCQHESSIIDNECKGSTDQGKRNLLQSMQPL